jgi:hypothetical protein
MALDYYLVIQNHHNDIEPRQVIESLISAFSLQPNPSSDLLINTGISVSVFKEDDEDDESYFFSPYPDVCVSFRLDKFEHYETGMNTMLKIVIWLMATFNVDMVLFFNEQKIFQRMASQLSINNDSEFWQSPQFYVPNQSSQFVNV